MLEKVFLYCRTRITATLLLFMTVLPTLGHASDLPTQGEVYIGVVFTGDLPRYHEAYRAFVSHLRTYPELFPRLKLYLQVPNPDPFSWENSVRRAASAGVDLLVTFGAPVTLAARKEASHVPLVYGDVYGPQLLNSRTDVRLLAEDVAGVSSHVPMSTLVRAFFQMSHFQKMGAIFNSLEPGAKLQIDELVQQAQVLGFSVITRNVQTSQQLEAALLEMETGVIDSLYLSESVLVGTMVDHILEWGLENNIPVISHSPGDAERGAVLTHEVSPLEQGRLMAQCVLAKMGNQKECPDILTPKKIDFCINLKSAKAYDLSVPFQTLTLATKVIR